MDLSRRQLLQVGLLGAAATALGTVAGCSSDAASDSSLKLWYWSGGLDPKVLTSAGKQFPKSHLKSSVIGGDFKQKLLTTFAGRKFVPDITGIKGEDIASFFPDASRFHDLKSLGADKLQSQYQDWKWKQGITKDGVMIGFPIDIGPTGLFYRADVFGKAGLPTDPATVSSQMSTWDDYFKAGVELKKALSNTYLVVDSPSVFGLVMGQSTKQFVDENDTFIGDQEHVRTAWSTAMTALKLGITSKIPDGSADWNAGVANGTLPADIGAAWHASDISGAAPKTTGKWRVAANPGGPADIGGSFLAIPKEAGDPELAFKVLTWILSADNQATALTDAALFPSTPATYRMPAMLKGDPFFGGQKTIDVFGPSAEKVPVAYVSPFDAQVRAPFFAELADVDSGKDPASAWNDAVSQAKVAAKQAGLKVS